MQFKTYYSDSLSFFKLQNEVAFKVLPSKAELKNLKSSLVYIQSMIRTILQAIQDFKGLVLEITEYPKIDDSPVRDSGK